MAHVPSVGIIGAGFVGGSLAKGFAHYTSVKVYDIDSSKCNSTYKNVIKQDVLFAALPTPMFTSGECDTRIIEDALNALNNAVNTKKLVVLRSTVPPTFIRQNIKTWKSLKLVYMPEFLTERSAELDFIQSSRFIFGTANGRNIPKPLVALFAHRFPRTRQVAMTWEEASLVKYATNVFFTVKLSFMNELYSIAKGLGQDGSAVIEELINDGRIGRSHYQVPGHDGDLGWGGHCFPKDNRAYSFFAGKSGITPHMADAAWVVNERVRTNRDWEAMKGRAVSDE